MANGRVQMDREGGEVGKEDSKMNQQVDGRKEG